MALFNHIIKRAVCLKKHEKEKTFTLAEAAALQDKTLKYLLRRAKITAFGEHYRFSTIIQSKEFVSMFRRQVPIHTYSDMYVRWWYRSLNGETYVTWPGKVKYYITKDLRQQITGKTIPASRALLKSYMIAAERYLARCGENKTNEKSNKASRLDFYKTYYGGNIDSILTHHYPVKYPVCLKNCFAFEKLSDESDFLLTDTGLVGLRNHKTNNFRLLVDNSLFYEFLPYDSTALPDKKAIKSSAENTITLAQIDNNKKYILLLTNNSGAWRYFTG